MGLLPGSNVAILDIGSSLCRIRVEDRLLESRSAELALQFVGRGGSRPWQRAGSSSRRAPVLHDDADVEILVIICRFSGHVRGILALASAFLRGPIGDTTTVQ